MKLLEDIKFSAITYEKLFCEQNSDFFRRKVPLALEKGDGLRQEKPKDFFFEQIQISSVERLTLMLPRNN